MTLLQSAESAQVCPVCAAQRPTGARYCPACHHDYESFMAKYGVVPEQPAWASASERVVPAPRRSWAAALLRIGAFLAGLTLLALAIVGATRTGVIPNWRFPLELWSLVVLQVLAPLGGGLLSLIVPGRFARGPFKAWLLGIAGWIPATMLLVHVVGWPPDGLIFFSGLVIHVLLATIGAAVLRLLLLVVFD